MFYGPFMLLCAFGRRSVLVFAIITATTVRKNCRPKEADFRKPGAEAVLNDGSSLSGAEIS